MSEVSMIMFVRACVEDSRSDLVGYYESHRSIPADTTEHDDALRWLDDEIAKFGTPVRTPNEIGDEG